ncbi:hypothetical protein X975_07828, partial [Stegodyphus mimosarum]
MKRTKIADKYLQFVMKIFSSKITYLMAIKMPQKALAERCNKKQRRL